jgi:hypothetical protein
MAALARITYLARALHPVRPARPLPVRVGPVCGPLGWADPDGVLRAGKE